MNTLVITLLLSMVSTPLLAAENMRVTLDDAQRSAFGITVKPIVAVDLALSKPYPATVKVPNAQLQVVSAALDGVVEALLVAEGEVVTEGQVLAKVRSPGLLKLQANYLETRTRRQLSSETLARDKKLYKEGIVAKRRLLETIATHKELLTAEERDRQTLLLVGMSEDMIKQLEKDHKLTTVLNVVTPISGVVLQQIATAGQRLAVSDPFYHIGKLRPLWLEVHVPLTALEGIHVGSDVYITQGDLKAQVITVGRMVHGADQGVLVRAEIDKGSEQLRPGQFIEARLSKGAGVEAMQVPVRSVLRMNGTDSIFIQRGDSFELLAVNIVSRASSHVIVQGDFSINDSVVTSGTAALKAAVAGGAE